MVLCRARFGLGQSGVGPVSAAGAPLHHQDVGIERGQALLRRRRAIAVRPGLQQGQRVEYGVVLHNLLAQQAVHDPGVGLEQRPLVANGLVRDQHGTGQRDHRPADPPSQAWLCVAHAADSGTRPGSGADDPPPGRPKADQTSEAATREAAEPRSAPSEARNARGLN
ncbi:hypothetical protein D9M69_522480 [compost metagenome]